MCYYEGLIVKRLHHIEFIMAWLQETVKPCNIPQTVQNIHNSHDKQNLLYMDIYVENIHERNADVSYELQFQIYV